MTQYGYFESIELIGINRALIIYIYIYIETYIPLCQYMVDDYRFCRLLVATAASIVELRSTGRLAYRNSTI